MGYLIFVFTKEIILSKRYVIVTLYNIIITWVKLLILISRLADSLMWRLADLWISGLQPVEEYLRVDGVGQFLVGCDPSCRFPLQIQLGWGGGVGVVDAEFPLLASIGGGRIKNAVGTVAAAVAAVGVGQGVGVTAVGGDLAQVAAIGPHQVGIPGRSRPHCLLFCKKAVHKLFQQCFCFVSISPHPVRRVGLSRR